MTNMVLLRNNGEAVAFGDNDGGQCDVPALPPSTRSVQVAVGGAHTVLLRSDGEVVAFGFNRGGRCDVPALPPGTQYAHTARENNVHSSLIAEAVRSLAKETVGGFVV